MRRNLLARIRSCGLIALAVVAATFASGLQSVATADSSRLRLTAMTYNLFQGSEVFDVISATTSQQFLAAVATDYGQVVATNFSERAAAIAAEVQTAGPDLIGLQEVAWWRHGPLQLDLVGQANATVTDYDFLQMLLD